MSDMGLDPSGAKPPARGGVVRYVPAAALAAAALIGIGYWAGRSRAPEAPPAAPTPEATATAPAGPEAGAAAQPQTAAETPPPAERAAPPPSLREEAAPALREDAPPTRKPPAPPVASRPARRAPARAGATAPAAAAPEAAAELAAPPAPAGPPQAIGPPRNFVPARTSVRNLKRARGSLPGFYSTGIQLRRAPDVPGRLAFEVTPEGPAAGDTYAVRVYLVNDGRKTITLDGLSVATVADGRRASSTVTPQTRSVRPRQRALVAELPGVWEASKNWAMEVTVTSRRRDVYSSRLSWN